MTVCKAMFLGFPSSKGLVYSYPTLRDVKISTQPGSPQFRTLPCIEVWGIKEKAKI